MQGTRVSPDSTRGSRDDGSELVDGFGTIKVTASILGDDLFTLRCDSNWGCTDILRRNCGGSGRCISGLCRFMVSHWRSTESANGVRL